MPASIQRKSTRIDHADNIEANSSGNKSHHWRSTGIPDPPNRSPLL